MEHLHNNIRMHVLHNQIYLILVNPIDDILAFGPRSTMHWSKFLLVCLVAFVGLRVQKIECTAMDSEGSFFGVTEVVLHVDND
jgi:hypothetical protein